MPAKWFETVAEAQRRAQKRLPPSVYSALLAGAEKGLTYADNIAAFDELGFAPHVAGQPSERDLSTSVMGQSISLPVLISPTGVQAVHPAAEVAVARAAATRGTAMGLSSFASKPVEEVVAANPRTFFQTYWCGTRDRIVQRIGRARDAGCVGLIVTLDWSFVHSRDWGSPFIPRRIDREAVLRYGPEAVRRPRWLGQWARSGGPPDLRVPNMALPGEDPPAFFDAYGEWIQTPAPSWDDLRWLREQWSGPFLVKGIMRIDDARRAVDIGATAVSVSNHGGNNLDSTPASVRALPAVVDWVVAATSSRCHRHQAGGATFSSLARIISLKTRPLSSKSLNISKLAHAGDSNTGPSFICSPSVTASSRLFTGYMFSTPTSLNAQSKRSLASPMRITAAACLRTE